MSGVCALVAKVINRWDDTTSSYFWLLWTICRWGIVWGYVIWSCMFRFFWFSNHVGRCCDTLVNSRCHYSVCNWWIFIRASQTWTILRRPSSAQRDKLITLVALNPLLMTATLYCVEISLAALGKANEETHTLKFVCTLFRPGVTNLFEAVGYP